MHVHMSMYTCALGVLDDFVSHKDAKRSCILGTGGGLRCDENYSTVGTRGRERSSKSERRLKASMYKGSASAPFLPNLKGQVEG